MVQKVWCSVSSNQTQLPLLLRPGCASVIILHAVAQSQAVCGHGTCLVLLFKVFLQKQNVSVVQATQDVDLLEDILPVTERAGPHFNTRALMHINITQCTLLLQDAQAFLRAVHKPPHALSACTHHDCRLSVDHLEFSHGMSASLTSGLCRKAPGRR
jgi:hypothetical protein